MLRFNDTALIFVLLLTFFTVIFANNRNTASDPRATLLVSESILTKGTIKLDHYGREVLDRYGYAVYRKNENYYYYFPIGTSLASLPFVAVANGIGLDMVKSEPAVQIAIASLTSITTLLILVKLASLFLNAKSALLVSSIFWFGTSLASTAGTALWSHNFATLFALLVIYLSVRAAKFNELQPWHLTSTFTFAAYLCRPTMALLAPFVILFVFTYSKVSAFKAGSFLAFLFGIFALFSMYEFGQILPDYYLSKRLAGGHFSDALYGNLLSPARGILIYSPFILFAWLCFKYSKKSWGLKKSWLLIALAWPVLHLIFISRFPHWWAGWSYGARFMTDVLPGLFLFTLYTWPTNFKAPTSKLLAAFLVAACGIAIIINTWQGLLNKYTVAWNGDPDIDRYPEYLFDWEYPQFLATKNGHSSRILRHGVKNIVPINPGTIADHTSNVVIYLGWSGAEATHRWSEGNESNIIFKIEDPEKFEGNIKLNVGALGKQQVVMTLNGTRIYADVITAQDDNIDIIFSSLLLQKGTNTLAFKFPNAHQPANGDQRVLALALKSFQIQ